MKFPSNFQKAGMTVWLAALLMLHGNAILKNEDPIEDTLTDTILYDQKMEQEKDGVKAPATPKVIYYGGQGFLTKSPLGKNEAESQPAAAKKKKQTFNWSDWWEEKPEDSGTVSAETEETNVAAAESAEITPENLSESSPADFWDDAPAPDEAMPETAPAADEWW